MTFFEFKPGEIISTVYTSYPTRSVALFAPTVVDGPLEDDFVSNFFQVFQSGTNYPGQGKRNFLNSEGYLVEQNFYISSSIRKYGLLSLIRTGSIQSSVTQLRNIYASNSFYKPQNYNSSTYGSRSSNTADVSSAIFSIPGFLIGSKVKPGSVAIYSQITGSSGSPASVIDDGYGGLYGDGLFFSSSYLAGCIMYEYGIIEMVKISDAPTNFADFFTNNLTLSFQATNNVPMNVYLCNSPKSKLNFSVNPSFTVLSGTKNEITTENPVTFTTAIGLYDENFELVGVAKVASPIKNEEKDSVQYRLKLNF